MHDLLIKSGKLVDPGLGIYDKRDIGISNGRIVSVAANLHEPDYKEVIDAQDKIVTPGLIDLHTHVAHGINELFLLPDTCGIQTGVTTVCDMGSTGFANFKVLKENIIPKAATDVFCFLNLLANGLETMPEEWSWSNVRIDETIRTIEENKDLIKGVKIRAISGMVRNLGIEGIKTAKLIARETKLPLMTHVGFEEEGLMPADQVDRFTREMLGLLEKGDIITHIYTWRQGRVINPDGTVLPELKEAIQRGALLDVANARSQHSIETARRAIDQGIVPTTLSTDLVSASKSDSVFSLSVTMSKFLAIGLSLPDVVKMTTVNPARILTLENSKGSLAPGRPADLSILELKEGNYTFNDGVEGKTYQGRLLLEPVMTVKSGIAMNAASGFFHSKSACSQ